MPCHLLKCCRWQMIRLDKTNKYYSEKKLTIAPVQRDALNLMKKRRRRNQVSIAINLPLNNCSRSFQYKYEIIKIICNSVEIPSPSFMLSMNSLRRLWIYRLCAIFFLHRDNPKIKEMRFTTMNFRRNRQHPLAQSLRI